MFDEHAMVSLVPDHTLWERCFIVAPLIVVGTKEADGSTDFAPKHMCAPMSWVDHFGFVCTPAHNTYQNAKREGAFTVSFPRPKQVVLASLAAAPRCDDAHKHSLDSLPTVAAEAVDGELLNDAYLHLECELDRIVDELADNSLIVGRVVAARAAADALRRPDVDDEDLVASSPLLAYLHPGRFAEIAQTHMFPFHVGWHR